MDDFFFQYFHIIFDFVNILNSLRCSRTRDSAENLLYLQEFDFKLIKLMPNFAISTLKISQVFGCLDVLESLGEFIDELINVIIKSSLNIHKRPPYLILPSLHNIMIRFITIYCFNSQISYLFKIVHF